VPDERAPGAIDADPTQPFEQVVDEPLAVPPSIWSIGRKQARVKA
jgi:hypothetical protein